MNFLFSPNSEPVHLQFLINFLPFRINLVIVQLALPTGECDACVGSLNPKPLCIASFSREAPVEAGTIVVTCNWVYSMTRPTLMPSATFRLAAVSWDHSDFRRRSVSQRVPWISVALLGRLSEWCAIEILSPYPY